MVQGHDLPGRRRVPQGPIEPCELRRDRRAGSDRTRRGARRTLHRPPVALHPEGGELGVAVGGRRGCRGWRGARCRGRGRRRRARRRSPEARPDRRRDRRCRRGAAARRRGPCRPSRAMAAAVAATRCRCHRCRRRPPCGGSGGSSAGKGYAQVSVGLPFQCVRKETIGRRYWKAATDATPTSSKAPTMTNPQMVRRRPWSVVAGVASVWSDAEVWDTCPPPTTVAGRRVRYQCQASIDFGTFASDTQARLATAGLGRSGGVRSLTTRQTTVPIEVVKKMAL